MLSKMLEIIDILNARFINDLLYLKVNFRESSLNSMWLPSHFVPQMTRVKYYQRLNLPIREMDMQKVNFLLKIISMCPDSILDNLCKQYISKRGLQLPHIDFSILNDKLAQLPSSYPLNEPEVISLLESVLIGVIERRRKKLSKSLKAVEYDLNLISNNLRPIRVINNVNLVPFPDNFVFVDDSVLPEELKMKAEICNCSECCCSDSCSHYSAERGQIAYGMDGKLRKPEVYLTCSRKTASGKTYKPGIHQCNEKCSCGPKCCNKVAQNGCYHELILCQTINGTGWGVLAGSAIAKGTFLGRYVGELMAYDDDVLRDRDSLYIFNLDVNFEIDEEETFCIDAKHVGNITRFFNHSCKPNVTAASVQIKSSDPRLFELSFFTSCEVQKGEQLCIDYGPHYNTGDICRCGFVKFCRNPFQKKNSEKAKNSRISDTPLHNSTDSFKDNAQTPRMSNSSFCTVRSSFQKKVRNYRGSNSSLRNVSNESRISFVKQINESKSRTTDCLCTTPHLLSNLTLNENNENQVNSQSMILEIAD